MYAPMMVATTDGNMSRANFETYFSINGLPAPFLMREL
jgi:hypothetical protein